MYTKFRINSTSSQKSQGMAHNSFSRWIAPTVANIKTSSKGSIEVSVSPISCLHDEPVLIKVHGLSPNQEVTVKASMRDTRNCHFMSYAHYRANGGGEVDVSTMESLGGQYEGLFPMGLIGSLVPAPNEYKYTRFIKRDVDKPNFVTVSVHNGHLNAEALCSTEAAEPLSSVLHERHFMGPGVHRIPVRYGKVRGCLYLPPGQGPFPGVIDMFGASGGLLEYRSAQLASRGFASLALAFFNYDDLPKSLTEFDIAYFEEAVEFLLKHDKVLDSGVGVIGVSKGGSLALTMAAVIPSIVACVLINCVCAPLNHGMKVGDQFYQPIFSNYDLIRITDDGMVLLKYSIPEHRVIKKLIPPIEKSKAAFLFLVGSDDQHMHSELYAQMACQHLAKKHYKHEYHVESFPGTGHLLESPYSPHCFASFLSLVKRHFVWGGSSKYHTTGQVEAWENMLKFLWYHLLENNQIASIAKSVCKL